MRQLPWQTSEVGQRPNQEPMVLARDDRADRNEVQDRAARATRQGLPIDAGRGDDNAFPAHAVIGSQGPGRARRGGDHPRDMLQGLPFQWAQSGDGRRRCR